MNDVIFVAVEDDELNQYPPKPTVGTGQRKMGGSLVSVLIFVLLFFMVSGGSIDMVIVMILILMIHEFGHLTAMKIFGYNDQDVFFLPLLGKVLKGGSPEVSQKKKIITLLAGPLPGILIGLGLLWHGARIDHDGISFIGVAFLMVNTFNLLPYDPLDGGKLLKVLFSSKSETIKLVFLFASLAIFIYATFFSIMMGVMAIFIGLRINSIFKTRKVRAKLILELDV
ncbi:MAG: hypothetical protein JKY54_16550, partial [Flavobacteriales bacterium]|nr:hypothetical protein [Flavobacteriales bacterium]